MVLAAALLGSCDFGRTSTGPDPVPESDVASVIATELCERFAECECNAVRYGVTAASCEVAAEQLVDGWLAAVEGLTYDGHCMARAPWTDCSGAVDDDEQSTPPCQLYSGSGSAGDACEKLGPYMSTCSNGWVCDVDDVCRRPGDALPFGLEGHRCGPAKADATRCLGDLVCIEGRCRRGATRGSSCGPDQPCENQSWCEQGVCVAPSLPGAACPTKPDCTGIDCGIHEACTSGLCDDGICASTQPLACRGFSW